MTKKRKWIISGIAVAACAAAMVAPGAWAQPRPLFQCESPAGGEEFVTYEVIGTGRYRASIVNANWSGLCDASLCNGQRCWEHLHQVNRPQTFDFDFRTGDRLVLQRRSRSRGACHAVARTESREQEACRSPSGVDEALFRDTGENGQGFYVHFRFDRIPDL